MVLQTGWAIFGQGDNCVHSWFVSTLHVSLSEIFLNHDENCANYAQMRWDSFKSCSSLTE